MNIKYYVKRKQDGSIDNVAKIIEEEWSFTQNQTPYGFYPYGVNNKGEWEFMPSLANIKDGNSEFKEATDDEVKIVEQEYKNEYKAKMPLIYYVFWDDHNGKVHNIVKREENKFYSYNKGDWVSNNSLGKIAFEITDYYEISKEEAERLIELRNNGKI